MANEVQAIEMPEEKENELPKALQKVKVSLCYLR